tara:strand:+ start:105 stop:305 length:201 start_codon:yes stop_codon:yes gene_type:complete
MIKDDEYLTRVVVDTNSRTFYLYSNEGQRREVECDTVDEFMHVLEVCRTFLDDDTVVYAEPVVCGA